MGSKQSKHPSKGELEEVFYLEGEEIYRKAFVSAAGRKYSCKKVENKANHPQGYCQVSFKGRGVMYHNIKWLLKYGTIPKGHTIDHIDRNKINNSFENLRLATDSEQQINREYKTQKGYSFDKRKNKWAARIRINSKSIYLGYYLSESEARKAFLRAQELAHLYTGDNKAFRKLIKTN